MAAVSLATPLVVLAGLIAVVAFLSVTLNVVVLAALATGVFVTLRERGAAAASGLPLRPVDHKGNQKDRKRDTDFPARHPALFGTDHGEEDQ
jgi:hypothetical protein